MAKVDPNKYRKNKDIKPESPFSVFVAVGRMALMLVGVAGIAMEIFREDGWLKILMAKIFQSTTSMLLIPVIIFALWLVNRWMTSPNKAEISKSGDLPLYVMMAVGAYYLFRLFTTGSF